MSTLKEIKKNSESILAIRSITSAYQEIADLRMKQVRERALKNREFFKELLSIYQRIKSAYIFSFKKLSLKRMEKPSRRATKERVTIFLSANNFFYGPLILNIWTKVFGYFKKNKTDLVVVGSVGKYLAENSGLGHKIFYFKLQDEKPELEKISDIVEFIKNYKKIVVFYGRYKTVLSQEPVVSEISEMSFEEGKEDKELKPYLFEPSPEALLDFFETEIMATLFNQCILEHQLAKHASRLIAMHQATENAKKMENKMKAVEKKIRKQILSKKQIELFASLKILKTEF